LWFQILIETCRQETFQSSHHKQEGHSWLETVITLDGGYWWHAHFTDVTTSGKKWKASLTPCSIFLGYFQISKDENWTRWAKLLEKPNKIVSSSEWFPINTVKYDGYGKKTIIFLLISLVYAWENFLSSENIKRPIHLTKSYLYKLWPLYSSNEQVSVLFLPFQYTFTLIVYKKCCIGADPHCTALKEWKYWAFRIQDINK
jgi:hypothetical protein